MDSEQRDLDTVNACHQHIHKGDRFAGASWHALLVAFLPGCSDGSCQWKPGTKGLCFQPTMCIKKGKNASRLTSALAVCEPYFPTWIFVL